MMQQIKLFVLVIIAFCVPINFFKIYTCRIRRKSLVSAWGLSENNAALFISFFFLKDMPFAEITDPIFLALKYIDGSQKRT